MEIDELLNQLPAVLESPFRVDFIAVAQQAAHHFRVKVLAFKSFPKVCGRIVQTDQLGKINHILSFRRKDFFPTDFYKYKTGSKSNIQ